MGESTRLSQRVPVLLHVAYQTTGELARDLIINISEGGVFIRTRSPLPIGTEINMAIQIGDEMPVAQRGRVTWVRGLADDDGMGVRFVPPVADSLVALVRMKSKQNA